MMEIRSYGTIWKWAVVNATKEQLHVVQCLERDLKELVSLPYCAKIAFVHKLEGPEWLGSWDGTNIELHNTLVNAALYRVLLHEIGHMVGLEHSSGIMAATVPRSGKLSVANRRKWCLELARKIVKHNIGKIK